MDKSLKLQVVFAALDKLSGPLRGLSGNAKKFRSDVAAARKEIASLGKLQRETQAFAKLKKQLQSTKSEMAAAKDRASRLGAELARTAQPTAKMRREFEAARKASDRLENQFAAQTKQLGSSRRALSDAGIDTRRLASHEKDLANRVAEATRRIGEQENRLERLGAAQRRADKIRSFGGKTALAGGAMTAGVTMPLVALGRNAVQASIEGRAAVAQVEASLTSMGNRAGRTLEQLQRQAHALMRSSLFDDDEILLKVTANMLTFGKVSGKSFDRAQLAAVNLSTKLNGDLQGSAIMVGKALNDPVRGVTALRRVGVSFTSQQQEMIKKLVAGGQAARAQALILSELERQYGGSAAAARKANPAAAAAISWGEFNQAIGDKLIPKLIPLVEKLSNVLDRFSNLPPGLQNFIVYAGIAAAVIGPVIIMLGSLMAAFAALIPIAAALGIGVAPLVAIIAAVAAVIGVAAYLIYKYWDQIVAAFRNAGPMILAALGPIGAVVGIVITHWDSIKSAFVGGWQKVKDFFASISLASIGRNLLAGLLNALPGGALASRLIEIGRRGVAAFGKKLEIHSPSRVFMRMGGHIVDGLGIGVDNRREIALNSVRRLATAVAAAGSLAAAPALAGDSLVSKGDRAQTIQTTASAGDTYHFSIQQQPGQSAEDLADEIIRRIERKKRARGGSEFGDG